MSIPTTIPDLVADRISARPKLRRNLEALYREVNGFTYLESKTEQDADRPATFIALENDLKARILAAVKIVSPTLTDSELWESVTTSTPKEFGIKAKQRLSERATTQEKIDALLAIDELTMLYLEGDLIVKEGMKDWRDPTFGIDKEDVTTTTRKVWIDEHNGAARITHDEIKDLI